MQRLPQQHHLETATEKLRPPGSYESGIGLSLWETRLVFPPATEVANPTVDLFPLPANRGAFTKNYTALSDGLTGRLQSGLTGDAAR